MFRFTFRQQVVTGFTISLLFVLLSALTSYFSIRSTAEDVAWENHTHDVIDTAKEAELFLLNAETGIRGFILTGRTQYLDPYHQHINKVLPRIKALKALTMDNPSQQERMDSLEFYAMQKIRDMQGVLQTYTSSGQNTAIKKLQTDNGKLSKDNMFRINKQIVDEEEKLLVIRKGNRIKSATRSTYIVVASALVIFGLVLYLSSFIKRTFDAQKLTEEKIREKNEQLAELAAENEQKNWLLSGASAINEFMHGEQEVDELSGNIITQLCNYLNAPIGALYVFDPQKQALQLSGSYAWSGRTEPIALGEGLVGQAALEQRVKQLNDLPADYIKISSGLGNSLPHTLFLLPVLFKKQTIAVIELGLSVPPVPIVIRLLNMITEHIGIGINSAIARAQLRDLFIQTQQQAEELESQQEELQTTNEELLHKSEELQASEEELRVQQEELRQTNAELEEKATQLQERNIAISETREAISLKAKELEISSKYKSEFLANMSHELRTPLNSILILARILQENKPDNLNEEQLKYATVIHNAGNDLLSLINDILDLSKIESGKVDLDIEPVRPDEIRQHMDALFEEIARSKKINFQASLAPDLPGQVITDLSRTEQIIKNLLSNAFKFTPENGVIKLEIGIAPKDRLFYSANLKNTAQQILSFSIKDSGIGIPEIKQKLIFEAFKQADGTTSRKYGGTGLGLSISKELANILGGEIQVESEPGTGSCFTLYLPVNHTVAELIEDQLETKITPLILAPVIEQVNRERKQTLLIVEDDIIFAEVLKNYALEKGFEPTVAHSGDEGLERAVNNLPDAIILDIMLPVMDGWAILKQLKSNPLTKHIPVHLLSAGDSKGERALQEGAIGFLRKPITKDQLDQVFTMLNSAHIIYNFKTVLLIEDQELQSLAVKDQLILKGITVTQAFTGDEALHQLDKQGFDCIILDLNLPDISGFDLLDQIKTQDRFAHVPVIINTAMELDQDKMAHIMKYSEAMVLKSTKSNDRLIDEVSLFMNKLQREDKPGITAAGAAVKNKTVSTLEKALKGKTILVTDDDMRNIFALSSALQAYDIKIVMATNGKEALAKLEQHQDIDLVLMDIMMPEMDGYEAMQAIRKIKAYQKLPIIALTAKAMKNDREKCITAGANDYITKPVDIDRLLSMLRVWLS